MRKALWVSALSAALVAPLAYGYEEAKKPAPAPKRLPMVPVKVMGDAVFTAEEATLKRTKDDKGRVTYTMLFENLSPNGMAIIHGHRAKLNVSLKDFLQRFDFKGIGTRGVVASIVADKFDASAPVGKQASMMVLMQPSYGKSVAKGEKADVTFKALPAGRLLNMQPGTYKGVIVSFQPRPALRVQPAGKAKSLIDRSTEATQHHDQHEPS